MLRRGPTLSTCSSSAAAAESRRSDPHTRWRAACRFPDLPVACRRSSAGWPPIRHRARRDLARAVADTHPSRLTPGAAGTIVRQHPHVRVYVHGRPARPHLADPTKLVAERGRGLYGIRWDRLWGEFAASACRESRTCPPTETVLDFGGALFDVGLHRGPRLLTTCATATGVRAWCTRATPGNPGRSEPYVLPPTPPPDIDVHAWQASIAESAGVAANGGVRHAFRAVPRR